MSLEQLYEMRAMKQAENPEQKKEIKSSLAEKLGQFGKDIQNTGVVKAGTSFVDALGNLPITIGNTLASPFTEQRVPTQNTIPGEGISKSLGRAAGGALGMMGLGGALGQGATAGLGALGRAAPGAQQATNYLTSGQALPATLGRFGEATTSAALTNPENPLGAAGGAAIAQAGLETIPYAGKGLGILAEYIPGTQYTKDTTQRLVEHMNKSEKSAVSNLDKAKKAAGDGMVEVGEGFIENMDDALPLLTKKERAIFDKFEKNNSYQNAFELQSTVGKRAREIKGSDFASVEARDKLNAFREGVLSDLKKSLSGNPEALKALNKGMHQYATEFSPYLKNPKFSQMQEGVIGGSGPGPRQGLAPEPTMQELQKLLQKEVTAKNPDGGYRFPENHPMLGELKNLNQRAGKSQLATMASLPISLPALIGKYYGFDAFQLATNPDVLKAMKTIDEALKATSPAISAGAQ